MKLVIIESPYAADTPDQLLKNILYARECVRYSLLHGEAPFASHLLYTQIGILNDEIPADRVLGMAAGHAWMEMADLCIVCIDLGISPGMHHGIDLALAADISVIYRSLEKGVDADSLDTLSQLP